MNIRNTCAGGSAVSYRLAKRWLSILLFNSMAVVILTACSGTDSGDDGSQTEHEIYSITELSSDEAPALANVTALRISSSAGEQIVLAESKGLIVRFTSGTSTFAKQNTLLSTIGSKSFSPLSIVNGLVYTQLEPGQSIEQAIQALSSDPSVRYVEPNYIYSTQAIPNDPRFSSQWALNNNGQTGGRSDADIDAPEAWDLQTGAEVIVGVIDTGVDYTHPDLSGNIWINPNEIPNNRVDDDGNGYVDDVRGWDFASNDNNPMDENNHGTHVSGIIAASGNNGVGVTGVNWRAKIMPLKFMNASGQGTTANAIRAIQYAVRNGARISNSSWGGPGFSRSLMDAISAANAAQHVFVAAAGNEGRNIDVSPTYPAAYNLPNIVAVAATNDNDAFAGFSNFGRSTVDVAAPGVSILSTVRFSNYRSFSGTSMAAPFVAGLASLIRSVNPTMSASGVISVINNNVDQSTVLSSRTVSGGRINVFKAISSITSAPDPVPVNVSVSASASSVTVGDSIVLTASGGTSPYIWSVSNTSLARVSVNGVLTGLAVGNVTVTATDSNGNRGTSNSISITAAVPPPPPPLILGPVTSNLGVGQTRQFSASGGVPPYSWSTSNSNIASINSSGLLTGNSPGTVFVTVRDSTNTVTSSDSVTVVSLTINPGNGILPVGDSVQLSVTGGGVPPYTWSSSNTSVLTVNSSGVLSAVGRGFAFVSVMDANGISTSSSDFEVRSISITPSSTSLLVGDSVQLVASGGAAPYQWSVNFPTVATVNGNGLLTAVANGAVRVFVMDADGFGAMSDEISVTDGNTLISITPNSANVSWGRWQLFTPSGGVPPYTFSLSNSSAGIIFNDTWPGWFRATGPIGSTTNIIVTDSNGDTATSSTVMVTQ